MNHVRRYALLITFLAMILVGCSAPPAARPASSTVPAPPATATDSRTGKVKIYYEGMAQVELIGPDGTRVLIDVASPGALSSPATDKDVLLTTHTHADHTNPVLLEAFTGQQLFAKEGTIKSDSLMVRGIASAHNAADTPKPENGTNYIFLVELGGLRIAHLGDCGQERLSTEQLAALGKVDVAITQFDNGFSDMNTTNRKGFNLMDQLNPRLIIPTHNSSPAAKLEGEKWPALYSENQAVSIGREDLTDETRILYLGPNQAKMYANLTGAKKVNW